MSKKKIKELLIIEENMPFAKELYAWITYEDSSFDVMLYSDAIIYLQKYSLANRFKNVEQLLKSFKTTYKTYDDFRKNDVRFLDHGDLLSKRRNEKEESLSDVGERLGIRPNLLSSLYWPNTPGYEKSKENYEKIRELVLKTCTKENIQYEHDKEKIINNVMETLSQEEMPAKKYPRSISELSMYYEELQSKVDGTDKYGHTYEDIIRELTTLKLSITDYTANMFHTTYQLLEALSNKKCVNREEILRKWAEFLTVMPEYIELINTVEDYMKDASDKKMRTNIDTFMQDEAFIREIDKLLEHDRNEEQYRFHATADVETGKSILEKGLFMGSWDLDSTSYPEFTRDQVLTYEYGSYYTRVGDAIVVFRVPDGEEVVRETTEEEREENKISSRRIFNTAGINQYVIDPKYIVGLIDRINKKVINLKEEKSITQIM